MGRWWHHNNGKGGNTLEKKVGELDVGMQIRKYRNLRKMSQLELGMKIGIDEDQAQQYIYKYEKNIIAIPSNMFFPSALLLFWLVLGFTFCLSQNHKNDHLPVLLPLM
jgi:Helix-turn-helix